ncbi:hypothetical protein B0H16DRAFT_1239569, partial [Mycena metata]
LRQHLRAHTASGEGWICCGVPRELRARFGLSEQVSSRTFRGMERVGGCMRHFENRAGLEDHLKEKFNAC